MSDTKCSIIVVEIADPDFDKLIYEVQRYRMTGDTNARIYGVAAYWSVKRWPNQILRVHKYNANLPAIRAENTNRPY